MIIQFSLASFASVPTSPPAPEAVDAPVPADVQSLDAEIEALERRLEAMRARSPRITVERPAGPPETVTYGRRLHLAAGESAADLVAFGENIRVDGTVHGDATSFGGNIDVGATGEVFGDVVAFGGRVRVEPGGILHGNRVDLGEAIERESVDRPRTWSDTVADAYHRLVLVLSFAGAGVLLVSLFPERVSRVARAVEEQPVMLGLWGATVSVLVTLFSALFLMFTVGLGFPVSLVAMSLLGAAWLLGFVGVCQVIGDRLPFAEKPNGRWVAFLIGSVMLGCVGSLPWLGMLAVFTGSMVGIGAVVVSRFGAPPQH